MDDGRRSLRVLVTSEGRDGRAVLVDALPPGAEVIAEAGDGPSAVETARRLQPDLVVLDLPLGHLADHAVLPRLRGAAPMARVVVLAEHADDDLLAHLAPAVEQRPRWAWSDSLVLPADRASPSRARRFVAERLQAAGVTPTLVDDALLVTSELVTNAVQHAGSDSTLHVGQEDGRLRLEVVDHAGDGPRPRVPEEERAGGRGLPIIAALAEAWGIDPTPDGKAVWAQLRS